jgi:maltooligosyltrehalose trehalohydrolase
MSLRRRHPFGAEISPDGGVHFRVWAPIRKRVEVVLGEQGDGAFELAAEGNGFFSAHVPDIEVGTFYRFRLDNESNFYPDPASRFQPDGPHGPSMVIDPMAYRWSDMTWKGTTLLGQVIYEMHIGTFTKEGTWAAAERELPELADVGITCIEVMPVADFPGRFGWGYDGVNLFAPTRLYGDPDDFRRFVDRAHQLGIGVILDVVYNHVGPDGNYLKMFSPAYFTTTYKTEWGEAINFDGPDSGPVRDFFAGNAAYWINEFHLDGLRLDATQNIYDEAIEPAKHILAEVGRRARAAADGRSIIIVSETDILNPRLVRPLERGGFGLDAIWNDDFHHTAMVAVTGRREGYYSNFRGSAQEIVSAVKYGYLFQGQPDNLRVRRGEAGLDISPPAFVNFLQNHDQIANSLHGLRLQFLTSPGRYRAMTVLLLLTPGTPMLFQGQEFASSAPLLYFADHQPELAARVDAGRRKYLEQFRSIADPQTNAMVASPGKFETFAKCHLDWNERRPDNPVLCLTRDLLRLRRSDPVFRLQKSREVDGALLTEQAFLLRYFAADGLDRLVVVNLGGDMQLASCAEPLAAPPAGHKWSVVLSTEDPIYGGGGTGPVGPTSDGWRIVAEAAIVFAPAMREQEA